MMHSREGEVHKQSRILFAVSIHSASRNLRVELTGLLQKLENEIVYNVIRNLVITRLENTVREQYVVRLKMCSLKEFCICGHIVR